MINVVKNGNEVTVVDGKVAVTYDQRKALILAKELLHVINPNLRIVDKKYQVKISEFRVIG